MPEPGFYYKQVAQNELPRSTFPFSHICISTACISTTNVSAGINADLYVGTCISMEYMWTCILQEVFSQSILMNAVTPTPNPQAALLIFTLINPFFCHHKSNDKGSHSKTTWTPVPRAAGAATPKCIRTRSFPDRGNAPAAAAKGYFRQTTRLTGTWTFQGVE